MALVNTAASCSQSTWKSMTRSLRFWTPKPTQYEDCRPGSTVVIGYVDGHGANGERVVYPRRLDGGRLSAYDHRADDVREFAVHRITGVRRA